jgi:hypothetical protein
MPFQTFQNTEIFYVWSQLLQYLGEPYGLLCILTPNKEQLFWWYRLDETETSLDPPPEIHRRTISGRED